MVYQEPAPGLAQAKCPGGEVLVSLGAGCCMSVLRLNPLHFPSALQVSLLIVPVKLHSWKGGHRFQVIVTDV